jgi:hypothetical protein
MIERIRELLRQRKIKEQDRLIEVLRRTENEPRRRPAAKFAMNRVRTK